MLCNSGQEARQPVAGLATVVSPEEVTVDEQGAGRGPGIPAKANGRRRMHGGKSPDQKTEIKRA